MPRRAAHIARVPVRPAPLLLPAEVLAQVFLKVRHEFGGLPGESPTPALRGFALVASHWRGEAQRVLFAHLRIHRLPRLRDFVNSDVIARLGSYVRSLELDFETGENASKPESFGSLAVKLLCHLPNLNSLVVYLTPLSVLSDPAITYLQKQARLSSLRKLELHVASKDWNSSVCQALLSLAPNIEKLTLDSHYPLAARTPSWIAPLLKLKHLNLVGLNCARVVMNGRIIPFSSFEGLQVLESDFRGLPSSEMITFFTCAGPTLQELVGAWRCLFLILVLLPHFVAVKALHLSTVCAKDEPLLGQLPPSIERLTIDSAFDMQDAFQGLALIDPSERKLQHLTIKLLSGSFELGSLPPLESLTIERIDYSRTDAVTTFGGMLRQVRKGELEIKRLILGSQLYQGLNRSIITELGIVNLGV